MANTTVGNNFRMQSRTPEGFASHFLRAISTWAGAIPLQSFWAIILTIPKNVFTEVENFKNKQYDNVDWGDFNMNAFDMMAYNTLYNTDEDEKYLYGCVFARSVSIPGEKIDTINTSIGSAGGLLFPEIIKNRNSGNSMQISFMETNVSYVDIVLRPWSIVTSYLGLVAREPSIKGRLQAIFYAKSQTMQDMQDPKSSVLASSAELIRKRKIFTFEDIVPVDVNAQEYSQRGESLVERSCKFNYSRYSVSTGDIDDSILYRK